MRDAVVLGGSLVELVLRERGLTGLVHLLKDPLPATPEAWVGRAIPGIGPTEREVRWRMLLDDLDRTRSAVLAEATAKAAAEAEVRQAEEQRLIDAMEETRAAQEAAELAAEHAELDEAAARSAQRASRERRD